MTRPKKVDNQGISEYEQQRLDNIKRNEEYLNSLGFNKKESTKTQAPVKKVVKKRKQEEDLDYFAVEPERRSRRIQQLTPEGTLLSEVSAAEQAQRVLERKAREKERILLLQDVDVETLIDDDENTLRCKVSAPELQAYIEQSNPDHYEKIGNDVSCCSFLYYFLKISNMHCIQ